MAIEDKNLPKYDRLREFLKDVILTGRLKPGERIPSENSLTSEFGVSRHTVRKAIDMLSKEGYLRTEHGRGTYCLDRSISRSPSRNIGVITTYISEYIFPGVIQGIERVLADSGYSIILKNTGNKPEKEASCLEDMLDKGVDGVIVEPTKSALFTENIKYYEALGRNRIPYVFIHGCYKQLEDKPQVVLDDAGGMRSLVEYLARLGHRHIAGIFKADDVQGLERHRGYAGALADMGLAYDPSRVAWFHTEDRDTMPPAAVTSLLKSDRDIDAIVCYNDEIANVVYNTLQGIGVKVPKDVSLTGFDDSSLALSCPVRLTTASHPKERLGEAAAELLLGLMGKGGEGLPAKCIMTPGLVLRDSCRSRL